MLNGQNVVGEDSLMCLDSGNVPNVIVTVWKTKLWAILVIALLIPLL